MMNISASWITSDITETLPLFQKGFVLREDVQSATLLISGLGMYEAFLNGEKAHNTFFEPGESVYQKTVFYNRFPVGHLLHPGKNELVVGLGNGFYYNEQKEDDRLNREPALLGERMLLVQLEIRLLHGETVTVCSDETWRCSKSPIVSSSWLGGEVCDDRITPRWDRRARLVPAPLPFQLREKPCPSITPWERITPVSAKTLENGHTLIDFGRNFAGTYTFHASAAEHTKVNLFFGEVLREDGSVDQRDFWGRIYDTYVFNASGRADYTPRFVYHGFRYIEVEGIQADVSNFTGIRLHCGNPPISRLKTDNKTVNKIHQLILNSFEDNMQSVITDCPHREKLGWTEVYQLLFSCYALNFDVREYYRKLLLDLADAQQESGSIPSIVPPFTKGIQVHALKEGDDETPNDPSWCGAIILAGFEYYRFYGDTEFLKALYPSMKKYLGYLSSLAENHLLPAENLNRELGDWMAVEPASVSFVVSCVYYRLHEIMSRISGILELPDDFCREKERIREAINRRWFHGDSYDNHSQSANAIALAYGICGREHEARVARSLMDSVLAHGCRLTVGEVALKPLFDVLCRYGRSDLAYQVLRNAYDVFAEHHTTLPESWDGKYSQNHAMLGAGDSFFFEHLAGISYGTGFETVELTPFFPQDMDACSLSLDSPRGLIQISWKRENGTVFYRCTHGKRVRVRFTPDEHCVFEEQLCH